MSIVSDSNHWMFISSNGGLTAGRKNAEYALFPYYTDDKITESSEITGSKTILRIVRSNKVWIWEPFSNLGTTNYKITRNLYKNTYGNKIIFEEINHDLQLTFKYQWASSNLYGFVRSAELCNNNLDSVSISLLDGLQNIMPYGVDSYTQTNSSNLVDAYKRTELIEKVGLGIFALSAIIVDKAEPSEALKANVVWSHGLEKPKYLLSSLQLDAFRKDGKISQETDIKAEKGAYFVQSDFSLKKDAKKYWYLIGNVNYDHSAVFSLADEIQNNDNLIGKITEDITKGTKNLISLCAAADGLQKTNDDFKDSRHFSNTMFNIMRGGIFDKDYVIEKADFATYLKGANRLIYEELKEALKKLPDSFSTSALQKLAIKKGNAHFTRLCTEYLPLKFSRRHGDPSRPWNRFSINTRSEKDGSKILDYEGNWRDIFQNWEALAIAYPNFIEGMIFKFLNASTFDGYNPYRVTKGGFDWETIEPDNPWSYIGYWGDHQIIYLLKFLEFSENLNPGAISRLLDNEIFVYANVPYQIKEYTHILKNPKNTIEFDEHSDKNIRKHREKIGADGALLCNQQGEIITANFLEKFLATTLAKVSNFVPEAGIWMNTQRPEWNDANNALVGNGVSMVTLCYLRRFLAFFKPIFEGTEKTTFEVATELYQFFEAVLHTLTTEKSVLQNSVDDYERKRIVDALGKAASDYRTKIYANKFSGKKKSLTTKELCSFVNLSLEYIEHTIDANCRENGMYHAYNLITVNDDNSISISYLDEMLEGQVAVLSSNYLSTESALKVLDGLKKSKLFREDQYSYLLYPNKNLPLFIEKNTISENQINTSSLLTKMVADGDNTLITKSITGTFHFNGNFRNANDVKLAFTHLRSSKYATLAKTEEKKVLGIFEDVFNHKAFTGRSGTFYGYEGLGSIYWHMVSKLLLATQECCLNAIESGARVEEVSRMLEHYYEINEGIGVHKSPELYGAFPTDPYSHTPAGKGAQQPGMTGQVKEDILSRFGELGVQIKDGRIHLRPTLLRKAEFLKQKATFKYVNLKGETAEIELKKDHLAFTLCQVPIIYGIGKEEKLILSKADGTNEIFPGKTLSVETSKSLVARSGEIVQVKLEIKESSLR
ncbi:hypothetical protein GCM10011414_21230 [Croceivirga lutea]|nr:hypothetical protein GCM10011414_21230 [Croceivirga lutea]